MVEDRAMATGFKEVIRVDPRVYTRTSHTTNKRCHVIIICGLYFLHINYL